MFSKKKNVQKMGLQKKIKNDIILIAVLIITISACALGLLLFRSEGDIAKVTINGELYGNFPLNTDQTIEIVSAYGKNVLVIEAGKAYIKDASCPDGICSSHRAINHNGQSIICLPNKLVVEIISLESDGPDIIS